MSAADQPPRYGTLTLQTDGALAILTLDRPAALNAIDIAMARDLQAAARWLQDRAALRVVLLRGAGKAFCAGGDIALLALLLRAEPIDAAQALQWGLVDRVAPAAER
ncbi:enoyl-CoA hydratase/isomerase family protein, partial [Bordetella pertussis]|uniref:enoyl-CoA hydratase/isomerase family protein n=1 Tax=Bordetella pertussis TaxID=520 RepID=UPI0018A6C8A7